MILPKYLLRVLLLGHSQTYHVCHTATKTPGHKCLPLLGKASPTTRCLLLGPPTCPNILQLTTPSAAPGQGFLLWGTSTHRCSLMGAKHTCSPWALRSREEGASPAAIHLYNVQGIADPTEGNRRASGMPSSKISADRTGSALGFWWTVA